MPGTFADFFVAGTQLTVASFGTFDYPERRTAAPIAAIPRIRLSPAAGGQGGAEYKRKAGIAAHIPSIPEKQTA